MIDVSPEMANSYFATRLHTEVWDSATASDRLKSLTQAGLLLERGIRWSSGATTVTASGTVLWAESVQNAVCEQALWLLAHDPFAEPELLSHGISSASVAGISVRLDSGTRAVFSPAALQIIGSLGTVMDRTDASGTVETSLLNH